MLAWPDIPAIDLPSLQSLLQQLRTIEYQPADTTAAQQQRQLDQLKQFAQTHSAYYRENPTAILSRRDLQTRLSDISTLHALPANHGGTGQVQTSGSSGVPVRLTRTGINQLFWSAHTLREHEWHNRDMAGRLAVIRANTSVTQIVNAPNWGPPANYFHQTGAACALPITMDVSQQSQHLAAFSPDYLIVYPNNLSALMDKGLTIPHLKQIKTIGETLSDTLRARVESEWGVKICDSYSSQELGYIAMQCPTSGLYHTTENLIVEILNDDDTPCADGQTGRVVITDLHNFATPLIRYDIGDYATRGGACTCGRTTPTITRIVGRERNMAYINGERRWPLVGFHRFRDVAPVTQYQIIQTTPNDLQTHLVTEQPLTKTQEDALTQIIHAALGFTPNNQFIYHQGEIPRPASGKFEEFVCKVV